MTNFDIREKGEYRRSNIHQAYLLAKNNFINGLVTSKANQTTIDDSMGVRERSREKLKPQQNLCHPNKDNNRRYKSKYFQNKCCCCCRNHKNRGESKNFYQNQHKIQHAKKMQIKQANNFRTVRDKEERKQITQANSDKREGSKEVKQKEIKREYEMRQQEDDSSIRQLLKQLNRLNQEPNLLESQKNERTLSDYSLFEFQIQE